MPWGDSVDGTELSSDDLLRGIAAIKKAQNITTEAAWSAFIDARPLTGGTAGATSANPSIETLMRAFFRALVKVNS